MTSHDVARLAGVSQPTVSRALRPDSPVSARTRERVRKAAETLGYVPSELGRSLATRSTRQIAMVADLENPLYPRLVGPLHDAFAAEGFRMVLLAEREERLDEVTRLFDGSVDGAVLTTSQLLSPLPGELQRRGIPFVQLNRVSELVEADSVTADNAAGGRAVAALLAGAGHRTIGAVLGPRETSSARERERGFRAGLRAAGITLPARQVVRGWFSYAVGYDGLHRLLSAPEPPTAVFCINDIVAVGALNAARERGLAVPGDLTVVGFDDLDIASWPVFDLTTVRIDFAAMARRAAELLLRRLGSPDAAPVHERFPVEPVLRRTHAER
ncbi:LacI family DNA-binding transcriptional regulator [Nakamurella endophytica]|uniref:LacI family DNA-binding transcriptional regulator n=1 Tax=Nakamurella endophytica TaxID=1748367 RepID=UPI001E649FC5|nr:LacI family DNA-binding transcriptional regulator [Nakamurella endophytica]